MKLIDGLGGFDLLLIAIFLVASSVVNGSTIDSVCGSTLGPNLKRTSIRAVVKDATKYNPPPQAAIFLSSKLETACNVGTIFTFVKRHK